jgi:transcription-repair coupling factor (superfamily II helicase)
LETQKLLSLFRLQSIVKETSSLLRTETDIRFHFKGLHGSALALWSSAIIKEQQGMHLFILSDKESAGYFYNDLEHIFEETKLTFEKRHVLFFPMSYRKPYRIEERENANVVLRAEVLNKVSSIGKNLVIVTYPEALAEQVIQLKQLKKNSIYIKTGAQMDMDELIERLSDQNFERVDFVTTPGEFSIRGGVVDIFSFSNDFPYRIEFFDEEIESIRTFNPNTQLSIASVSAFNIVPNIQLSVSEEKREPFWDFLPERTVVWMENIGQISEILDKTMKEAKIAYESLSGEVRHLPPEQLFTSGKQFRQGIAKFRTIQTGSENAFKAQEIAFETMPQPNFNKNFNMLIDTIRGNAMDNIQTVILSENPQQLARLKTIFEDFEQKSGLLLHHQTLPFSLHDGFIDYQTKLALFVDHQIFGRYHRVKVRDHISGKEATTIKELYELKKGDFVTHIDHGVGRFDGLEVIDNNGRKQEAVRLIYQNNDILYVSIHALHRISKYVGKEGTPPPLNRLGSNAWQNLKNKTKSRVKDIARELIRLYAQRKATKGFAFSEDTYLQHELEASFLYEDTPDQWKATQAVKKDMEAEAPMDRLVCGDVGFGKTEVAVRAAFKAVADSKQAALLVPTTILAFQHYNTFKSRLNDFPCRVEYISRFRSAKQIKEILQDVESGKVDILIGTHRLLSKDVKFKDLGLLVIDEEQKFGVTAKETLKKMKVNVDSLTLTATPIPRTLQFSMMGARDMSVINTPPPNRQPIETELHVFNENIIRDAILQEVTRGGQVFFVHNHIQNIKEIAGMIQRLCPDLRIAIGHGQMDGRTLENIIMDFIDEQYDVLVATTIIESGLDIPNVNTIIINEAHHYGLSDLHQLRGRVGRSDRKAFCYLLAPPVTLLTDEARKRLRAIEEFSNLGGGLNIALRDLDIRGAGNILGGEQSGFIADVGFEMYHKILDEAILELKEEEFKEFYNPLEEENADFVSDCIIETDLEVMFPSDYIANIQERLSLYRELDAIENDAALNKFTEALKDRFGALPRQAEDLISTVHLRRLGKKFGIEKIVLKQDKMVAWFIAKQESPFYQSPQFGAILQYLQINQKNCRMKENNGRLSLIIDKIPDVTTALQRFWNIETNMENK